MLGLSEAARLVGRDVSTLHRAMKSGRLAYTMGADGKRRLDPAELERVFEIKSVIPGGNGLGDDEGNAAPVRGQCGAVSCNPQTRPKKRKSSLRCGTALRVRTQPLRICEPASTRRPRGGGRSGSRKLTSAAGCWRS